VAFQDMFQGQDPSTISSLGNSAAASLKVLSFLGSCFSLGLSEGKTTIQLKVNSKHPTKTRLVNTHTLICPQKTRPAIASNLKKFYRPLSFVVG